MAVGWDGMTDQDGAGEGADAGPSRVERTGIAVVHEGEYVVPAPGAQARLTAAAPVVTYQFPVEIDVVGRLDAAAIARVAQHVFAELDREILSRL
jgi:hypothetical protein